MTKKQAIANYTRAYAAYLETITVGGDKNIALAFAVKDMLNQTKSLSAKASAFQINDEAEYLLGKMA